MKVTGHHMKSAEQLILEIVDEPWANVPARVADKLAEWEHHGAVTVLAKQIKLAKEIASNSSSPFKQRALNEFALGMEEMIKNIQEGKNV